MGVFSSKRRIRVYSNVMNIASPDKMNFLATVVGSASIGRQTLSIAEQIQQALIHGPGMNMRNYAKWARKKNYAAFMGLSAPQLLLGDNIDLSVLTTQLPLPPVGSRVSISKAYIGPADYSVWVDNWFTANHPTEINDDYTVEPDEATGTIITIKFADGRPGYTFPLVDFNPSGTYLYCLYTEVGQNTVGPINFGPLVQVASPTDWPSTSGMDPAGTTNTNKTLTLLTTVNTVVTYSDGRPGSDDTTTSTRPHPYVETDNAYDTVEFIGSNPSGTETNSLRRVLTLRQTSIPVVVTTSKTDTEFLPGGVSKTTVTKTDREDPDFGYFYRRDTQVITNRTFSTQRIFTYALNSGNPVLDAMFKPSTTNDRFYPLIPFKDTERYMSDPRNPRSSFPPGYPWVEWSVGPYDVMAAKALKQLAKQDYAKTFKSIYRTYNKGGFGGPGTAGLYILPAIPLNTKTMEAKKYLFEFFETFSTYSGGSQAAYIAWQASWNTADTSQKAWVKWRDAQAVPTDPLFGTPEPVRIPYPSSQGFSIRNSGSNFNYDQITSWSAIGVTTGTGSGWAGARAGQVQLTMGFNREYTEYITSGGVTQAFPSSTDMFTITKQLTADTWKTLSVYDLLNTNVVYKGRTVVTRAAQALGSSDPSPLLLPLHEGIFTSMSLKDSTQMCVDNLYVLINTYTDVQVSSGLLVKIIMVVIVAVLTVISGGAGGITSPGLLGTAGAVGGFLGFTGTVAILVGTVANAVAALLLAKLITMGAQALFGEQIGAIVGMIASIYAVNYGTSVVNGTTFNAASVMSSPEALFKLSVAAGSGYTGLVAQDTQDIVTKSQAFAEQYSSSMDEIQKKMDELLGNGRATYDPLALLDIGKSDVFLYEPSNSFLARTLLTGSDIASMSNLGISNFAALGTSTELPT